VKTAIFGRRTSTLEQKELIVLRLFLEEYKNDTAAADTESDRHKSHYCTLTVSTTLCKLSLLLYKLANANWLSIRQPLTV
jgi:hypothetical protein